jgi:uncharacterized protein YkwD
LSHRSGSWGSLGIADRGVCPPTGPSLHGDKVIDSAVPRTTTSAFARRLAALLAATVATLTLIGIGAAPVGASTSDSMADSVLGWMNQDREARGLEPYRRWYKLTELAEARAGRMASVNTLSHDAAGGDIGAAYDSAGIDWMGYGEIIGTSTYSWGTPAANNIYGLWKNSAPHAAIMFSSSFNYIGIGFAYRSSNGSTWASILFSESKDHTDPIAEKDGVSHVGATVYFRWTGHDPKLQTHTAGIDSFDVQYRVDGDDWRTIRNDTSARLLKLYDRRHGHWYRFRVRAKDGRGNLSPWTSAANVWVP